MANTTRATSLYLPPTQYGSQSETNFYPRFSEDPTLNSRTLRSLSPEDVQKMKYKIDLGKRGDHFRNDETRLIRFLLDKQVAEKQQRLAREWEKKIERDRKYVS